jgi:hypothetical protein
MLALLPAMGHQAEARAPLTSTSELGLPLIYRLREIMHAMSFIQKRMCGSDENQIRYVQ